MNIHDDARTDRSDGDVPTDDEVTTDVDPAWIAAIRTELDVEADATDPGVETTGGGSDDAAWLDAEPAWDPEATVGVSDGLIERIRSEIATTSPTPTPASGRTAAPPPSPPEPSIDAPMARPVPPAARLLAHGRASTVRLRSRSLRHRSTRCRSRNEPR